MNDVTLRGVRILFVLPSLGLGGAERQALLLAKHLRDREHADARLLSLGDSRGLIHLCEAAGVPFSFFELQHGYRSRLGQAKDVLRFTGLLRRSRAQILLPYCMFQNVLCALTWRAGGARLCVWNQRDEGRFRLERWIERAAVQQTSRFISNSIHGADFVRNELGAPATKVDVVANGIIMPTAQSAEKDWRRALDLPPQSFVACMVANLHSKKDHPTLIAAWRHVVDKLGEAGRSAQLLLAGQFADTHAQLVNQVAELKLERHVHFLGQVQRVEDLLRTVDLAVFSSYNEGIPNAVLEAMSHELAVAGTDYAGIREALGPDATDLLAPMRDSEALANRILLAASNQELRERLGRLGRQRVANLFSAERMASQMTGIIRSEWVRTVTPQRRGSKSLDLRTLAS